MNLFTEDKNGLMIQIPRGMTIDQVFSRIKVSEPVSCDYCGSVGHGDRCNSCGAPAAVSVRKNIMLVDSRLAREIATCKLL